MCIDGGRYRAGRQRGLTIVELIIFMVIVGVAAAGVIGILNLSATASADPLRRKQALMVAEALMEEVQLARFTLCQPSDPQAGVATTVADCSANSAVTVGARPAGASRPYLNVADYATALDTAQASFSNGASGAAAFDVDVNGNALGQAGTASLAALRSTVELKLIAANAAGANKLGPPGRQIDATAADLRVLRIIVRTRYGNGANDVIALEGYRTRYAPRSLP